MRAEEWFDKHEQELIDDTCMLVRIPSVSVETGNPDMPYGKACLDALHACLNLGEKIGLTPFNHENRCGTLLWKGKTETEIGICAHSDVVPAGNGWSHDPFDPVVENGLIIGRGAADNKIAIVTMLMVLRYLKENGFEPRHSIRFFIGCSEETGMDDLEYYASHYKEPAFTIVPDSTFPLIHGEKGLLEIDAELKAESSVLKSFQAGVMSNAVPAHAEAVLKGTETVAKALECAGGSITYDKESGTIRVSVEGIPAHAAFPEGSESAEVKLAKILLEADVLDEAGKKMMESSVHFFSDYYGAGLGIAFSDDISGKLTHVGGMAEYKDGVFWQNINIRYNITADAKVLVENIRKTMGAYGYRLTKVENSDPCYTDKNHPVVQELTAICNRHLGTNLEPFVMGGGTYARKLKHAVGFGPGIPGRLKRFGATRGGAHQADEYAEVALYKKAFLIYAEAIPKLDQLVEA